jgi:DNA invertase Pin-like site-specific DNA recombinase
MMSLTTFADELEREKARQRTADAMDRKARAGHVTGGKVFGYENVGLNSLVERRTWSPRPIRRVAADPARQPGPGPPGASAAGRADHVVAGRGL